MSSDKEQFTETGEESKGLGSIHIEDRTAEALLEIQPPYAEKRITSLVIVPTVAVEVSARVDPDADPLMTRLGAMTTSELTTYIKDEISLGERVLADEKLAADEYKRIKGQRLQVTYEVICALRELKSRCKASKTWEKALNECGIVPSTWRSWDCRELNQLTTGKRTKSRKPKPDGRSLAQVRADVAAAKAGIDAQRADAAAQPDPIEPKYIDAPVDSPAIALAKKVIETYKELASGVQPSILRWDALKELAESVMGINPTFNEERVALESTWAKAAAKPEADFNAMTDLTLETRTDPTSEPSAPVRITIKTSEAAVTDAGMCPVCSKPYLRLDEQWHAHVYVHKEHRETGKRKPVLDSYCRTGAGDDNCPACGEKYVNALWSPKDHCHFYYHDDFTVDGDMRLSEVSCKGPHKGRVKKAPAPAKVTAWHSRVIKGREQAKAERKSTPPYTRRW